MIRISGVTHHYGEKPVLENVDFQVDTGEVVAVLGPNGMGKTTLLQLIAGVLHPCRGTVEVHGKIRRSSLEDEMAIRAATMYLPDSEWFPGTRTIRQHLLYVAELYGRDVLSAMEHADRLFELFSLNDKADSTTDRCSTGQQKKAALCVALAANAPLLLMDEPFSGGLDPGGIIALKHLLKRMSKKAGNGNQTVVFTSPVPEIVEDIADKIAIIQDRGVLVHDTPEAICEMTGEKTLEQALDKLMHSDTIERVNHYFEAI